MSNRRESVSLPIAERPVEQRLSLFINFLLSGESTSIVQKVCEYGLQEESPNLSIKEKSIIFGFVKSLFAQFEIQDMIDRLSEEYSILKDQDRNKLCFLIKKIEQLCFASEKCYGDNGGKNEKIGEWTTKLRLLQTHLSNYVKSLDDVASQTAVDPKPTVGITEESSAKEPPVVIIEEPSVSENVEEDDGSGDFGKTQFFPKQIETLTATELQNAVEIVNRDCPVFLKDSAHKLTEAVSSFDTLVRKDTGVSAEEKQMMAALEKVYDSLKEFLEKLADADGENKSQCSFVFLNAINKGILPFFTLHTLNSRGRKYPIDDQTMSNFMKILEFRKPKLTAKQQEDYDNFQKKIRNQNARDKAGKKGL